MPREPRQQLRAGNSLIFVMAAKSPSSVKASHVPPCSPSIPENMVCPFSVFHLCNGVVFLSIRSSLLNATILVENSKVRLGLY